MFEIGFLLVLRAMRNICVLLTGIWMALAGNAMAQYVNPLHIPDTLTGPVFNLNVGMSTRDFLPGTLTNTYGVNGPYLAPTLIVRKGDLVTMNVTNNLMDGTTMHWHGMHVAAHNDGGPHTEIPVGTTWSPQFTILDEATTMWYHPHLHEHTAEQVYYGVAGMIIVRDDHSDSLNLPHRYGIDDFPIIIQDKSFDTTNQLIFTELADTIAINGTLGAYLDVPAQMVRFRLLNGSSQRVYNVGFPPNLPVFQIASDGGLLEGPVPVNTVMVAPGERAEVVVNFAQQVNQVFPFPTFNSQLPRGVSGGPGGPGGGPGNPLDSADFVMMEFRVKPPTADPIFTLPNALNTLNRPNPALAARTRIKTFDADPSGFPYLINSTPYDMMHNNDTVILNDIEIWELRNETDVAHPFHIHDIHFFITDFNGGPPPPRYSGRKDVVLLEPGDTISFITQFTDFADSVTPYMYHCHNLFHEDGGMMGQFIVVEESWLSRTQAQARALGLRVFPNPTADVFHVEVIDPQAGLLKGARLLDLQGRTLQVLPAEMRDRLSVDLSGLPSGMYMLEVQGSKGGRQALRVQKR
jgi:FtsP/CotA-like multicopper oxidase with cupredoxin domain